MTRIGIDYGKDQMLICLGEEILRIPATVAFELKTRKVAAFSREGRQKAERYPGRYVSENIGGATESVQIDFFYETIETLLGDRILRRPELVVALSANPSETLCRGLARAAAQAGIRSVHLIDRHLCIAAGAGIDVSRNRAVLVVYMEEQDIRIAVVRNGKVIAKSRVDVPADYASESIRRYFLKNRRCIVGRRTIVYLKKKLHVKYGADERKMIPVRDAATSVRKKISIGGLKAYDVYEDVYRQTRESIMRLTRRLPEATVRQIRESGLVLTGAQAALPGVERFLEFATGIQTVSVASDELAARGAFMYKVSGEEK